MDLKYRIKNASIIESPWNTTEFYSRNNILMLNDELQT